MRALVSFSLLQAALMTSCWLITSGCEKAQAPESTQSPLPAPSAQSSEKKINHRVVSTPGTETSPQPPLARPNRSGQDLGPFEEHNKDITLTCPSWLDEAAAVRIVQPKPRPSLLVISGVPVCESSEKHSEIKIIELSSLRENDLDGDGFVDQLDLLRGAKKAVLNGAAYRGGYHTLDFPGGDVPLDQGVCTDVIIRAMRNAGIDLQEELSRDIKARAQAYPMVKKADTNIDHRRVRTLLPYFKKHFQALGTDIQDLAEPFLPGDIVFMNTMGDRAPEHLGIISDTLGKSGRPLVINNWTDGTKTAEMDLLKRVPVTHRFRIGKELVVSQSAEGLEAFLKRQKLELPPESGQALTVVAPMWSSSGATLQRWERDPKEENWSPLGPGVPVRLGRAGLAAGRGFSQPDGDAARKKEGDKRSPAGVFRLGTAFGKSPYAPYAGDYSYRQVKPGDYWVDEASSPLYNTWQHLAGATPAPWSAEDLTMYRLGLVVEHNTKQTVAGAGSAIFLHPWSAPTQATIGCTSMPTGRLLSILSWLDEKKAPVLVQSAGHVFQPTAP